MQSDNNQLLLCFYGDDFTGSTASLECLARAGARSVLFIEPPTAERLTRYPGVRAVGVAGMTRSMTPDAMEAALRPALSALRELGSAHVHYKVCSTFDSSPSIGSIGHAIDVAMEIFGSRFVPLLVAAPALGRYCVFGNLFAQLGQEREAFRLDRHPSMSRHPVTPAGESDLRLHLGLQTARKIGLFDIRKISLPQTQAQAELKALLGTGAEIVLFDVLHQEQLQRIGQLMDAFANSNAPLFSVGSSAVEEALGAHWAAEGRLKPVDNWPEPGPNGPLLVASGSCSPVTTSQIKRALSKGFAEVPLDTPSLAAGKRMVEIEQEAIEKAVQHLKAGRGVIIHTSEGEKDPQLKAASGRLFGGALSRIIREAVAKTGVRRLVVAGGDTSGHVAQALGIEALEIIAPLAPGAPLCRAHAPGQPADGLEVSFKGGQMGGVDYFDVVANGRLNC